MSDYSQTHCAIYLRGNAQAIERQRQDIQRAFIKPFGITQVTEYAEAESGHNPDRPAYLAMLKDAAAGRIQMILVATPDRFDCDAVEAMRAMQELLAYQVEIRFATLPEAVITNSEQRLILGILFLFAETESLRIGQRVKGGMLIKMQNGGIVGKAPDGYLNKQRQRQAGEEQISGPTLRWIEPDPKRWHIWREAWQLLVTDQYTLAQICQKLHDRGYTYRGGRSFIEVLPDGRLKANVSTLSRIFRNPAYAGWIVSKTDGVGSFQQRGNWQPLISDNDFLRGLEILRRRNRIRDPQHRHFYLLKSLLFLEHQGHLIRRPAPNPT